MPTGEISELPGGEALPLRRERLYELVWQEPMLRVAARFEVSSSYMARVCEELNVPRPPRGYWAKLTVGQRLPKPALPAAQAGDATEWNPGVAIARRSTRPQASDPSSSLGSPRANKERRHPLLSGVESHFLKTRSKDRELLRPFKYLLVDLVVSESTLASAVRTASKLFNALGDRSHRVVIAPPQAPGRRMEVDVRESAKKNEHAERTWQPSRPTIAYFGDVPIGLTLFETLEEVEVMYISGGEYVPVKSLTAQQRRKGSWTTTRRYPSGRLCLQAYCLHYRAPWFKQWRETRRGELDELVPDIIAFLEGVAPDVGRQAAEAEELVLAEHRQWEESWRRQKEEAERARREALRVAARKDLLAAIAGWHEATRIHAYFEAVQKVVADLPPDERVEIAQRLDAARALIGTPAPLELLKAWKTPDERS